MSCSYIIQAQSPCMSSHPKPVPHRYHDARNPKPDGRVDRHPCLAIRVVVIWCWPSSHHLRGEVGNVARHSDVCCRLLQTRGGASRLQGSRPDIYICVRHAGGSLPARRSLPERRKATWHRLAHLHSDARLMFAGRSSIRACALK